MYKLLCKATWQFFPALSVFSFIFGLLAGVFSIPITEAQTVGTAQVTASVKNDTSPPLRTLTTSARPQGTRVEPNLKLLSPLNRPHENIQAIQNQPGTASVPATSLNFDGIGNGFTGPQGTFTINSAPPNTNGAAGPNHYVQTADNEFAVFDKSGTAVYGPLPINVLWSGFGGGCQNNNDGEPVVLYDGLADRWLISQYSVTSTPYLICVAVSTSPDPTGSWFRYSFVYNNNFPSFPKLGVWPDGYYFTFNEFNAAGTAFLGGRVGVLDRSKMLLGQAATQQSFSVGAAYGGLLTSTLDGTIQPPAGSPNWVVAMNGDGNHLAYWKFHTDWATPANSSLAGPNVLSVDAYAEACSGATCIPQSGTTQKLDSLGEFLMYRLAYRNFGDHEAMVVSHSVTAGSSVGMRWYELRPSGGALAVYQQGTYAPDSNYRWMGSIAMDHSGNMALGFSISSSTMYPGIAYTGRLASDSLGTMAQGETNVITGGGSQTGSSLSSWGNYSSMAIDPSDDCTFWYTNEYIPTDGAYNWHTRIATFKFPGCNAVTPPNDFSMSASPASLSLVQGTQGNTTINTSVTSGSAESITLSSSGLPAGATATFNPASMSAGAGSTLTINTGNAAAGTYILTVTGTAASAIHTTSVSLTITASGGGGIGINNGGFETGTLSGWTQTGSASVVNSGAHSGTYAALVGSTVATNGNSSLTQTFSAPSGSNQLGFWYKITCPDTVTYDWATATLKDNTTATIATILNKACTNNGTWQQATGLLTAGHSYTLTLVSHDDNYAGDPTYVLYDDIAITAASTGSTGITNGGFETGTLSGWVSAGTASIGNKGVHSGTYAARVGSTTATNGNSTLTQTFTAPSGVTRLSLWYANNCPDTVTYDWATVTLKDNTTGTNTTVLAKTCAATMAWANLTTAVTAGHSYTLTLVSHDDNYSSDPTYTLYDDVVLK